MNILHLANLLLGLGLLGAFPLEHHRLRVRHAKEKTEVQDS
jgi:hypothetical protein